jgi:PTH2 family peptidyl-tRNA hydrolase
MEHKQVIVLRKDLNMRKGKMVAQGAHASMRAILNGARREGDVLIIPLDARNEPWLCGRFKKICVSVNSESELLKLHERALNSGLILGTRRCCARPSTEHSAGAAGGSTS